MSEKDEEKQVGLSMAKPDNHGKRWASLHSASTYKPALRLLNNNQDRISIVEDTASVVTAGDRVMVEGWRGGVANDAERRAIV